MYYFHALALISSQPKYYAVNVSIKAQHRNAIDSPPGWRMIVLAVQLCSRIIWL